MKNGTLNLARKWRSKNFDQIVGQDLSVRMLKNSLYKSYYFPVYLFSGQRGCGKTSLARIFACAVNCEQLPEFQKNPKLHSVPCLSCSSCRAMANSEHPDFIEIDAASHTGVDNVRQIIDMASLLPVMGTKKIYLIDEAHMLSRAAFNAFLKILEEPPASVLFILATTDAQKVIETVRSRCFQLFFKAIKPELLVKHLTVVCEQEGIRFEPEALTLIIKETEGSVRDALNLLEQIRFSTGFVSKAVVYDILGYLENEAILGLFERIVQGDLQKLFSFLQNKQLQNFSAPFIWKKLLELLRAILWIKHGVSSEHFVEYSNQLNYLASAVSIVQINQMLEFLYTNEQFFLKTTGQHSFLEMVFLQLCQKIKNSSSGSTPLSSVPAFSSTASSDDGQEDFQEEDDGDEADEQWGAFLSLMNNGSDPLLHSLFFQASFEYKKEDQMGTIIFPEQQIFLKDLVDDNKLVWEPLLKQIFGQNIRIVISFTGKNNSDDSLSKKQLSTNIKRETSDLKPSVQTPSKKIEAPIRKSYARQVPKKTVVDVSDTQMWKKAHFLLNHFPGVITEIEHEVRN